MNELFYPKYSKGTKVRVYRAFQGYCGIGKIIKGFPTGLIPYYHVELLSGNYLGIEAPTKCYVDEIDLEVLTNETRI